MTTQYWTLSSDSHVAEPPDVFTSRMGDEFGDLTPHVVQIDGIDYWSVDGDISLPVTNVARAGDRFELPENRPVRKTFAEDVRPGAYDPDLYLKDNEQDGVWGALIFPTTGVQIYGVRSNELLDAAARAYNDWAFEFVGAHPDRLKAAAIVSVHDVASAVAQLQRAGAGGATAALIPSTPPRGRLYHLPEYEPLWEAAADLGLPLTLHAATNQNPSGWKEVLGPSGVVNFNDFSVRSAITDMVFAGVFERHPSLKVVSVENEGGWAPFMIARMDWTYRYHFRLMEQYQKFSDGMLPSDFVRRNVYFSFIEDRLLVEQREHVGVGRIMWSNDYPHAEGSFPRSMQLLEEQFAGVPDAERRQITLTNAMDVYGFAPPPRVTSTNGSIDHP